MEYKNTIFLPKTTFEKRANLPSKEPGIIEGWNKENIYKKLREKFSGTPDKVVNFFTFDAMEVRELLASLGFKSLEEIIGRSDLLYQVSRGSPNLDDLDLNPMLVQADPGENKRFSSQNIINPVPDNNIDENVWKDIKEKIKDKKEVIFEAKVKNTDRAVGTKLSHYLFKNLSENISEKKVSLNFINNIHKIILNDLKPNITFILSVSPIISKLVP